MASPPSSGMASGPGPACQACSRGRRHLLPQSACLGLQCHPRNSPALRPTAQIGLQPPCPDGAPGRAAGASPSALPPPAPPLLIPHPVSRPEVTTSSEILCSHGSAVWSWESPLPSLDCSCPIWKTQKVLGAVQAGCDTAVNRKSPHLQGVSGPRSANPGPGSQVPEPVSVAHVLYVSGYWGARKKGLCCFIEGDPRKTSEDFSRDPHPGPERWRSWVGPGKPHPLPKPEL